jgi:hypothetical protein
MKNLQLPAIFQASGLDLQKNHQIRARTDESNHALEADIGTLTHQYLEIIVKQGLENWPISRLKPLESAIQRWFTQRGYKESQASTAALQVQSLLETTLTSEDGQWVLQAHEESSAELSLSTNVGSEAKQFVVDRTFLTEENGKKIRWIIDYKTDDVALTTSEAFLFDLANQYSAQVENYAKLFAYEGFSIKRAIFFVRLGKLVLIDSSLNAV